jgi:hypothetical protein
MRSTPEPTSRDLPPLGAPIRPSKPAPAPTPTETPGILRRPDGTLETQIPAGNERWPR